MLQEHRGKVIYTETEGKNTSSGCTRLHYIVRWLPKCDERIMLFIVTSILVSINSQKAKVRGYKQNDVVP